MLRRFLTHGNTSALTSSQIIMRKLSTHTVLIKHSDGQGHGSYLKGFTKMITDELLSELHRVGIPSSALSLHPEGVFDSHKTKKGLHFMPVLTNLNYQAQILLGEQIDASVKIVGLNKQAGQIILSNRLKKPSGKTASTGYHVLQKYENGRPASLTNDEEEILKKRLQTTYSAAVNGFNMPVLTSPSQIIGKEMELTEEECRIQKDQTGHNGVIDANKIFDELHSKGYEKLITGTGEGFADKKGKPVMTESNVYNYRSLGEGDNIRIFICVLQNSNGKSFDNGKFSWVGTLTDEVGNIVAIAHCKHTLLDMNNKPVKTPDQKFLDRLAEYAVPQDQGYENLFETGAMPNAKNIKLELNRGVATVTINVQDKPQNMITAGLLIDLKNAVDVAIQENQRVLVLQSGRDGMFIVGADVNDFANATSPAQVELFSERAQLALKYLSNNNQIPTVAVTSGNTLGGGLEAALACDFRVSARDTKLGQVEVLLGVIPAFDACQRLTSLVGLSEAARLIISGETLDAEQAYQLGLIDQIVDTKDEADAFIRKVMVGQVSPKPKRSLSKDDEASFMRLKEMIDENYQKQISVIKNLEQNKSITPEESSNICQWLLGVKNAREAAWEVLSVQSKTNSSEGKSRIERQAFTKLALTPEAKFATLLWLLDKKNHKKEYELIMEYLIKAGLFYIPAIVPLQTTKQESAAVEKSDQTPTLCRRK